ncbi:uncharacterized protein ACRADG_000169 isoform 1-T4 [Cochliomyia hominivorax]
MALRPTTKLKEASIGFLIFIILSSSISSSQGGVIKKRELNLEPTTETSLKDHFRNNLTEIQPTILTAINTKNDVVTTKLQLVPGKSFVTESSKELTNNEILLNEAKKLLEEEEKIIKTNKEAEIKEEQREEKEEQLKNVTEEKTNNSLPDTQTQSPDNLQDIKQIILNLENKEQQLSENSKTSQEFGTNGIKEEKLDKLKGSFDNKELDESENSRSLENLIKPNEEKPRPPSKILTELRTETEAVHKEPKLKETQVENSIDSIKLNSEEKVNKDTSIEIITEKTETSTTPQKMEDLQENKLEKEENEKESLEIKTLQAKLLEKDLKTTNSLDPLERKNENEQETSTSGNSNTDNLKVIEITTLKPVKEQINENLDSTENGLLENKQNNKIPSLMEQKDLFKTEKPLLETTLQPETKESDLLVFEGEKKEYARSVFKEEPTTLTAIATNEVLMPITTYRPIILSVKEENLKDGESEEPFIPKEKKPKFINDNSTNAQQLNLPNNPEVWSLAAMKSLPKTNDSLATITHEHNQTLTEDFKENLVNNSSKEMKMMVNANSEKNLLDWSQIMMDKELATSTIRNEEKVIEKMEMEEDNLTTLKPEEISFNQKPELREGGVEEKENVIYYTLKDLPSSTTVATILSLAANNISETDKKSQVEINNNEMETITKYLDVATATTTESSKLVNNPFNATLNIEPHLNKINLTLNHTQPAEINGEKMHTTEKQVTGNMEDAVTSPSTPTLTQTEATAVDMTKVEQISNETTTVSTLETSKPNVSLLNATNSIQNENSSQINVNFEKLNYTTESNHKLENSEKINNRYNDNELNSNSAIATTTTTVLPITTFRPNILAITSTTSLPVTFEQEIQFDQNGNNTKQQQQKQSIITTTTSEPYKNNSMNTSETHLSEREFETSTTITTTTTITTIEIPTTTTPLTELNATKTDTENILTSSGEINSSTTSSPKTTTSFSTEQTIINETTERIFETKEETTKTTPKQQEEVDETTIGSAVVAEKNTENIEKKEEDITEIPTTITTVIPDIIIATTTTTSESTKPPVVVYESSVKPTTTSPTTTSSSDLNKTETEDGILITTQETEHKEEDLVAKEKGEEDKENAKLETTTMATTTAATQTISEMPATVIKDEETYISLLDDTTTTTTQLYSPAIFTTTTQTPVVVKDFTSSPTSAVTPPAASPSTTTTTMPSAITTKIEEIYNVIHSTTTELIQTTTPQLVTEIVKESSSPTTTTTTSSSTSTTEEITPLPTNIIGTADIGKTLPTLTSIMGGNSGNMYPKNADNSGETDVNVIIAITVSVIGVIALILLVGFLYLMRKRQKQNSYPNRCRPVSMDEFTIDNASVGGSMRKSSALRSSKRTYGNLAFDDPSLRHNPMGVHELAKFVQERLRIFEEFRDVPQITSRLDEVPAGCEDKNRYANVLPLPETRVILQRLNDDDKTEYINANYVTGPKDPPNYYIACQAPLESTVEDFWRMIWEQQSRVIIQATDLIENGVEKCAEYLPPSVTLDNHSSFGDFQITLQNREVKDKYAISTLLLKNVNENASRELTHYWYKWPEVGVPSEEAPIIAMLLEARSSLISYAIEQANEDKEKSSMATLKSAEEGTAGAMNGGASPTTNNSNGSSANGSSGEINGNISMVHIKKTARNQGPLTVHCSPGTGRTGTIIACDIAIRSLETPKRTVDIPQIVYYVRRGRASAVLTKEQYEFIYKVANMYAAKISNPTNYN